MLNVGPCLLRNQKLGDSQKALLAHLVFVVLEILSQGLCDSLAVLANGVPDGIA